MPPEPTPEPIPYSTPDSPIGPPVGPSSAAPPAAARYLALLAVLVAGACGGLVGYSVTELQCTDGCPALAGSFGAVGAVGAAVGVGIVATLTLRAMAEWRAGQLQQAARDHHPLD